MFPHLASTMNILLSLLYSHSPIYLSLDSFINPSYLLKYFKLKCRHLPTSSKYFNIHIYTALFF